MEIWKSIKGFEDRYEVSTFGRIKSLSRVKVGKSNSSFVTEEKILSLSFNKDGYKKCSLHKDGKRYTYQVHRLVAETFIPNPNNLSQVNHKDWDRTNNTVSNLEWCSHRYNSENRRIKSNRAFTEYRIAQFDFCGKCIGTYDNINSASLSTDIIPSRIKLCADGVINQAGNYIWKYIKD